MGKVAQREEFIRRLVAEYCQKHPRSERYYQNSCSHLIRGGSHTLRLFQPFPFYDVRCQGSRVIDLDGHSYIDFWQGHYANILGHNPKLISDVLVDRLRKGEGLHTGFPSTLQCDFARLLLGQIKGEKVRFTTSGALATIFAVMLARAYTGRDLILKVAGGWHGTNPYLLKGIIHYDGGLNRLESSGLHRGAEEGTIVTTYNNIEDLTEKFTRYGERIACFIMEPFLGEGGFILADEEYVAKARDLTRQYGALLIFDEVISAFRFCPAGLQNLYGVQPDLSTFGKIIGGGMPLAAVMGREEVMSQCHPDAPSDRRVKIEGGTFSVHPSSLLAGLTLLTYLIEHEAEIYPKIGEMGERLRKGAEEIFSEEGIRVKCTGWGNSVVKHGSMGMIHFLRDGQGRIDNPEKVWNPAVCDVEMREWVLKLAMLNEGVNTLHGLGAVSAAHTKEDIDQCLAALRRVARKLKGTI